MPLSNKPHVSLRKLEPAVSQYARACPSLQELDVADNFDLGRARQLFKKMARNKDLKILYDDYTNTN